MTATAPPFASHRKPLAAGVRCHDGFSVCTSAFTCPRCQPSPCTESGAPGSDDCAALQSNGQLSDADCGTPKQFTCRLQPSDCPPGFVRASIGNQPAACYKFLAAGLDQPSSDVECAAADATAKLATVGSTDELEFLFGMCSM